MQKQHLRSPGPLNWFGAALFAVSITASSQALATDLNSPLPPLSYKDAPPVVAPFGWGGFYFGGHAGGAWGGPNVSDTFVYVGDPTFNGALNRAGFIGGGQAGYNFQRGGFVFGLESDIGYLGLSASKGRSFKPNSCVSPLGHQYTDKYCWVDARYSDSSDLNGDITGRLGYSAGRTLFYVKGGVAFLDADVKANYSGQNVNTINRVSGATPSTFNYDHSDTLVGWTIGGGVEYALNPSWSLKAEYQHFDFGHMSYSYSDCYKIPGHTSNCATGSFVSVLNGKTDASVTADAAILGVNYHLGN